MQLHEKRIACQCGKCPPDKTLIGFELVADQAEEVPLLEGILQAVKAGMAKSGRVTFETAVEADVVWPTVLEVQHD